MHFRHSAMQYGMCVLQSGKIVTMKWKCHLILAYFDSKQLTLEKFCDSHGPIEQFAYEIERKESE